MNMLLFSLVLNPLLYLLEQNLTDNKLGHCTTKTAVVAYADDIKIFVTRPADIQAIDEILHTYGRAMGACLNIRKSKALAVGAWDSSINRLDIPHQPEMTILGFRCTNTIARLGNATCSRLVGKVKARANEWYGRDLCLTQRVQYVHVYFLSKIWHVAYIFSATKEHERQLLTAISWYIWRGAIFRVPLSNLQRHSEEGSLDVFDVAAKCHAMFLTRLWSQGERDGTLTADWLCVWALLAS
jgi:hypothetical protein